MSGRTWLARCVVLAAAVAAARGEIKPRRITMRDGRTYVGRVGRDGGAVVVRTADKHVYLSGAFVARNEAVDAAHEDPVYTFNTKLAATEKKGKIAHVVQNVVWGQPDASGKVGIQLTDPKLGALSYTMVIVKITPVVFRLEGVEYEHSWSFPLRSWGPLVTRMVQSKIDRADPASLLKAARFLRMAGQFDTASGMLRQMQSAGGDAKIVAAERAEVFAEQLRRKLTRAKMLVATNHHTQAVSYLNALTAPASLAKTHPALAAEAAATAEAVAADVRAMYNAKKLLAARKIKADGLTLDQARRLVKVLRGAAADRHALRLAEKWAEPMADMKLTDKVIAEAIDLADSTAELFRRGSPAAADPLAEKFTRSTLPMKLKLSIFRYAARFEKPPAPVAWQRVEFKHARSGREYHYYIQLPSNYHPDRPTPAILSLHGQSSTAETVRRSWGPHAEKLGMILIGPEYIYGRKWGYHFSVDEHEAVLGALWHAAGRYNIDPDRVFLQGGSQGGHASWDIGAAHAGQLAGLVPIIGAPIIKTSFPNFQDLAVYSVDGEKDAAAPTYNRAWIKAVAGLKCDATYVEYLGRGHEGFGEEYDAIGQWMLQRVRRRPAERITLVAHRGCDCRRRWVRVRLPRTPLGDRLIQGAGREVKVIATCRNNVITASVTNVRRIQFFLSADLIDFARPVTVLVAARRRLSRTFQPNWSIALEESLHRRDRTLVYLGEATIQL